MNNQAATPAEQLVGFELNGGWEVMSKKDRSPESTGGNFSHGYLVKSKEGKHGYLKALDYSKALQTPDPAETLKAMTEAYVFEREICDLCKNQHLSRVVTAIDDGSISVVGQTVQYLIFELADNDIRVAISLGDELELAWLLRTLHHVGVGLNQLHTTGIAHQDLKPSNVLIFDEKQTKVADLGRAVWKDVTSPHDNLRIPGDMSYAPPELLYGFVSSEWNQRRFGSDAYHFGSLIAFLFSGVHMTALIAAHVVPGYHWDTFGGDYKEALPYVREAFGKAVLLIKSSITTYTCDDIIEMIRQLCDPDPSMRGHPRNICTKGNQYRLERYISRLDCLATRAEYGLFRSGSSGNNTRR